MYIYVHMNTNQKSGRWFQKIPCFIMKPSLNHSMVLGIHRKPYYPLVMTNSSLLAIEIVSFPMNSMVIFHCVM